MANPLAIRERGERISSLVCGDVLFGRFEVRQLLGSGGFGRVSRCFDHETATEVALKELHRFGPDALLRFKNEFRSLSDIHHPNLVRIGDLLESDDRRWAFTMEYVPGTDLLSWVRNGLPPGQFHEGRLRAALSQLTLGLDALHSVGLLHRDVKPENVRVTHHGRVVLLDFGLVTHLSADAQTDEAAAVGTVSFMAPEQAEHPVGPKADFYALGVLLYEVLTGRMPFEGSSFSIMLAKTERAPEPPSKHNPDVPRDLGRICEALLRADPEQRAGAQEVFDALGESHPDSTLISTSMEFPRRGEGGPRFIGRRRELAQLREQWELARNTGLRVALLEGESGIGKTALMEAFVHTLQAQHSDLLVLRGRCHPAELVRYKLWDGVADTLCKHLRGLAEPECRAVLPPNPDLVSMLFPVLTRVQTIPSPLARSRIRMDDAATERFRAFSEVGVLLQRLAQRRPVLMCVDDVQWGDLDSLAILQVMLALRDSPRAFWVGTVRPLAELEAEYGKRVQELVNSHECVQRIQVGALSEPDARNLSAQLTGLSPDHHIAQRVVKQTHGHPWFATELAHHLEQLDGESIAHAKLDDVLRQRVEAQGPGARRIVELLSLGGGPQPASVLREALDLEGESLEHALSALRAGKLVRPAKRGRWVCYHDRIREAVAADLSPEVRRALHARLASAWAISGGDPSRIAGHWQAADEPLQALPWLREAAEHAERAGAYDQAATLYGSVLHELEQAGSDSRERHVLRAQLADALASAGRCAASARVLLQLLEEEGEQAGVELRVQAAERLLQAGLVSEGVEAGRQAFEALGMRWPGGSKSAAAWLRWHRFCLGLTRVEIPQAPDAPEPAEQIALDTMWRLTLPLAWVDITRFAELTARHLRLSLRSGVPKHIVLALLGEAASAAAGDRNLTRSEALLEVAEPWVQQLAIPQVTAYRDFIRGSCAAAQGDFEAAQGLLARAERSNRDHCPTDAWTRTNVRALQLSAWWAQGKFEHHAAKADRWIVEAQLREDLFAETVLAARGLGSLRHCMTDQPDRALEELSRVAVPWRDTNTGVQHVVSMLAHHQVLRYRGNGSAEVYWRHAWPTLTRSPAMRLRYLADLARVARMAAALEACVQQGASDPDVRALDRLVRATSQAQTAIGRGQAALVLAQVSLLRGDGPRALLQAQQARQALEGSSSCFVRAALLLECYCQTPERLPEVRAEALAWYESKGWRRPDLAVQMFGLPIYRWLVERHT